MGLGNLTNRSAGQTILDTFFNDIHGALNGDFVGRNSSGVATSGQSLGTLAFPWGTAYVNQLILNGSAVDTSSVTSPANRVISGVKRGVAGSNLNQFLVPNGAALSAIVDATPTNLLVAVNAATVTFSSDVTKTGLTAAPSSNNTALVDDALAADQFDTRNWGAPWHRRSLTIDTAGTEITSLIGKWAAFMIAGTTNEYFLAYVESATQLSNCYRGFFYDSSLAPVKAAAFSNNDVITLLKLTWWFAENDGATVDVTYNNPTWSFTAPGSPVTGDYWFDMGNNVWKRYDGATFQIINRTFIGWTINTTTACVGARCVDSYSQFKSDNTIEIVKSTTEIALTSERDATINVAGTLLQYGNDRPLWNITTDLASSSDMFDSTEQASRPYYLYVKQNGDTVISDIFPYHRRDIQGWYHPYNIWRCVGVAYNDASSNITSAQQVDASRITGRLRVQGGNGSGGTNTRIRRFVNIRENTLGKLAYTDVAANGTELFCNFPGSFKLGYGDETTADMTVWGFSLNSTELTTGISAITLTDVIGYTSISNATGTIIPFTDLVHLKLGDVVRPHRGGGTVSDSSDELTVTATEVA